jgi:hypothetical protein
MEFRAYKDLRVSPVLKEFKEAKDYRVSQVHLAELRSNTTSMRIPQT